MNVFIDSKDDVPLACLYKLPKSALPSFIYKPSARADETPLKPLRSRSGKMTRNYHSESKLGRNAAPAFTRLHSDNFLYCSDFVHVDENAKKVPRPVTRKQSFGSDTSTLSETFDSLEEENNTDNVRRQQTTLQNDTSPVDRRTSMTAFSERCLRRETSFYRRRVSLPSPPVRHLRREVSFYQKSVPTHDRWNECDKLPRCHRHCRNRRRNSIFNGSIATSTSSITYDSGEDGEEEDNALPHTSSAAGIGHGENDANVLDESSNSELPNITRLGHTSTVNRPILP